VKGNLEDLQLKALQNRPDLRAAQQGVTAANSQLELQKAIGKQDVTVQGNYSHVNGINAATRLEAFRCRYLIATRAKSRAHASRLLKPGTGEGDQRSGPHRCLRCLSRPANNDKVVQLYISTYLDVATRSRDISEYAYHHGGISLLNFLDAERSYRATQLAYRQALASYLLALEQLRKLSVVRELCPDQREFCNGFRN
jgi:cobalt-zinc-cadmium efflux system outer membrane protein